MLHYIYFIFFSSSISRIFQGPNFFDFADIATEPYMANRYISTFLSIAGPFSYLTWQSKLEISLRIYSPVNNRLDDINE